MMNMDEILYFYTMKEDITRGGNLVHLFVISASIGILLLYPILVPNFTSASKNALFAYAVDIESLIEQGNAAYDEGRSEEAIQYFDQALAIDPENVTALVSKGLALEDLDRTEEAIQYDDRALAIDPSDTDALDSKGLALYNLDRIG